MARRMKNVNGYWWGSTVLEWFKYLHDPQLHSSDYRILFFLMEIMKIEDNTAYIKQKEIAGFLSMDKGNVSKSIKRLREKQFIVKAPNGFMINPHLFYVNPGNRESLREKFNGLLNQQHIRPRFYMNEDDKILELLDEQIVNGGFF